MSIFVFLFFYFHFVNSLDLIPIGIFLPETSRVTLALNLLKNNSSSTTVLKVRIQIILS